MQVSPCLGQMQGFIIEKDAEGCFELLLRLHPQAGALQEEEARLFYSKALTLCLECESFLTT